MRPLFTRNGNLLPTHAEAEAQRLRWAQIEAINTDECDDDELVRRDTLIVVAEAIDEKHREMRRALAGGIQ